MERKYGVKIWSGNMELKMERKYGVKNGAEICSGKNIFRSKK
jgi:hypothetical protein